MDSVRSLLLVPADDPAASDRATAAGSSAPPDATLIDLMHTDAAGHDDAAASIRARIAAGHRIYLHTRGPQSPDLRDQLLATLPSTGVYGVSIPGVVHLDQLRFVDSLLEDIEQHAGIEPGLTAIGLWVESAAALGKAGELAAASSRLTWLGVATAHLAMELALDAPAATLLDHARARVVFAAQASGLPAIEGLPLPPIAPNDAHLRSLGLRGRMTRHVSEVAGLHAAFPAMPSA
ncbi:MAG: citrate lyase subunit beta / citryl-CoA lyase [Chloroflexi bacterium]|nr:MAG: citrate lyase subunit beta / citryl-CoA lyase [Chloroflexota bacterium]